MGRLKSVARGIERRRMHDTSCASFYIWRERRQDQQEMWSSGPFRPIHERRRTRVVAMVRFPCSPAGRNISGQSLGICGNLKSLR
jgi:hypothetical protein